MASAGSVPPPLVMATCEAVLSKAVAPGTSFGAASVQPALGAKLQGAQSDDDMPPLLPATDEPWFESAAAECSACDMPFLRGGVLAPVTPVVIDDCEPRADLCDSVKAFFDAGGRATYTRYVDRSDGCSLGDAEVVPHPPLQADVSLPAGAGDPGPPPAHGWSGDGPADYPGDADADDEDPFGHGRLVTHCDQDEEMRCYRWRPQKRPRLQTAPAVPRFEAAAASTRQTGGQADTRERNAER